MYMYDSKNNLFYSKEIDYLHNIIECVFSNARNLTKRNGSLIFYMAEPIVSWVFFSKQMWTKLVDYKMFEIAC